jgi:hypothetical protein
VDEVLRLHRQHRAALGITLALLLSGLGSIAACGTDSVSQTRILLNDAIQAPAASSASLASQLANLCGSSSLPFNACTAPPDAGCDTLSAMYLHPPDAGAVILCSFFDRDAQAPPYFLIPDDDPNSANWQPWNALLISCVATGALSATLCGDVTLPTTLPGRGAGIAAELCMLTALGCTLTPSDGGPYTVSCPSSLSDAGCGGGAATDAQVDSGAGAQAGCGAVGTSAGTGGVSSGVNVALSP